MDGVISWIDSIELFFVGDVAHYIDAFMMRTYALLIMLYKEGTVDATPVGSPILWKDGSTMRVPSALKPLPVETVSSSGNYIQRIAYDGSNNIEYVGRADPGSAASAAVWEIKKLAYSSNNLVSVLYADGNVNFDNVWDDRASLTYS